MSDVSTTSTTERKPRKKRSDAGKSRVKKGNTSNVVSLESVRKKTTVKVAKKGKPGSPEWYSKYPHVVAGSYRDPTEHDKKELDAKCHGKVCTVKCVDSGKLRVVNAQDAFQVKRTTDAQKAFQKKNRAERRVSKKTKRATN